MFKIALHTYLPQRYQRRASFELAEVARHILDFKDGRKYASRWAAAEVVQALSASDMTETVIACVPASSSYSNARRYKRFSSLVCSRTGALNGYDHIQVIGKRTRLHQNRQAVIDDNVVLDNDYFAGKRVVVIDDICTTGSSANAFIEKLQGAGANVRMVLFLGKTWRYAR